MKLTVLGASGGCGKELVKQAVANGHQVTAVVRPQSVGAVPPGATVLSGALDDVNFLRSAIKGTDAVMSALGSRLESIAPWGKIPDPGFVVRSARAVVEAMKAEKVDALWAISAGGVGDSVNKVPAVFRLFIKATALRKAYVELEEMERVYQSAGLSVCLPRPTGLTDGPALHQVIETERLVGNAQISRADVAFWMLSQWERRLKPQGAPIITTTGAA